MLLENQITVIYDGHCQFCKASVDWIQQRVAVDAKAFQDVELSRYGLTYEQCSQAVHVISDEKILAGAGAVAFLLKKRGNQGLALFITVSGPLGRWGYHWVSTHRSSALVGFAHRLLNWSNSKHDRKKNR
jgi:predicted DCC family thiol-disulfide oxidoreductase YuxK